MNTSWYDPTATDFVLETPEQLAGLANLVNNLVDDFQGKVIRLGADMVLNDISNWEDWDQIPPSNVWTPIGSNPSVFSGTFLGQGHSISGMYIRFHHEQGLFGTIDGARVENVGITASYLADGGYIGGIAAYNYGTIQSCWNTATIQGYDSIGGIVGINYGSLIGCWNDGAIRGETYVGGICGYNSSSPVFANCYNYSPVSGVTYVGGITGINFSRLYNNFNSGPISANAFAGGISGDNQARIENSFNTGNIQASEYCGGISGGNYASKANINNCYNLGNVSGSFMIGGISGDNTEYAQINNCYASCLVSCFGDLISPITSSYPSLVSNSYYNADLYSGSMMEGIGLSEAVLKEPDFPGTLGAAFQYDELNTNNGFPVLKVFYDFTQEGTTDGSEDAPHEIWFPQQLGMIELMYSAYGMPDTAHFVLKSNLHMGAKVGNRKRSCHTDPG